MGVVHTEAVQISINSLRDRVTIITPGAIAFECWPMSPDGLAALRHFASEQNVRRWRAAALASLGRFALVIGGVIVGAIVF